jgi:RNA polymerase sigma factor (sigma-70 family)
MPDLVEVRGSVESIQGLVARLQATGASGTERREAFGVLAESFRHLAYVLALASLRDAGQAEDAAQEAFVTAYCFLDDLRDPSAFPGWFRRIVRTHCHRLTRGKGRPVTAIDAADEFPSPVPDPPDLLEHAELRRAVRAAIVALPERERTALVLFYLGDYSLAEIATLLAVPITTVKKRLQYGRQRLKARGAGALRGDRDELGPSADSPFAHWIQVRRVADSLAQKGQSEVDDLLALDGVDDAWRAADLHALRHEVTQAAYRAFLQALLLDGVDPNAQDGEGTSPLAWAAEHGDAETLAHLLSPHIGRRRAKAGRASD